MPTRGFLSVEYHNRNKYGNFIKRFILILPDGQLRMPRYCI